MQLIIRQPQPEDQKNLEQIFLIAREVTFIPQPGEIFRLNDYSESIIGEEVWVAEKDSTVVGFVSFKIQDDFVHNLFVHPNWHRMGVGSALLKTAESRLQHPIELRVRLENWKACNFYEKNGWIQYERHVNSEDQYYRYLKYAS